ncbi:MAG: phosphonate ABC transporter ATP-binding protein [Candidatus Woesearchaeota archaeon]
MIKIENLTHTYKNRNEEAIKCINLHIKKGESIVIIGSSGSGKSTLLRCINKLIEPNSGKILIEDEDIINCSAKKAEKIRGKIAMIFQNFNLIERESVLKNVLNGRLKYNSTIKTLFGKFSKEDYNIVKENIKIVGLEGYEEERINNLSGGQKQRVAIARALSQKPDIILADEPVSNLDPMLMTEIMDLLKSICDKKNITLITSLHFLEFAKRYGTRIIGMRNGQIVFNGTPEELTERDIVEIYQKTQN